MPRELSQLFNRPRGQPPKLSAWTPKARAHVAASPILIPPVASSSLGIAGLMRMPMLTMHTEVTQSPFRRDPQRGTQSGRVGSLASEGQSVRLRVRRIIGPEFGFSGLTDRTPFGERFIA